MTEQVDGRGRRWFLHLSDIHFRKRKGDSYDPYDLDEDLRDQLELDLARMRARIGVPFVGIIVTGDITFQASEPEFDVASKWLRRVSELCGCPPESVYCVAGNHDADRGVFEKSLLLRGLHERLRASEPDKIDFALGETLRDDDAATLLMRPLEQYNRFAAKFGCITKINQLFWEHRVPLNDESMLVLRGGNSVLVSNKDDNDKANKLILGTLQATARERPDEAVLFACHHPLDWLLDADHIAPILKSRARIHLFGHKHTQVVEKVDNSVRIVAGAVHPDRREPNWRPRFNCIGFLVEGVGEHRKLELTLYPRVWSQTEPKYVADHDLCGGPDHKSYELNLPTWTAPTAERVPAPTQAPVVRSDHTNEGASMDPARTLTYRFLSLPHVVRLEIAQAMKLLHEEDEGIQDAILLERILSRAAAETRLGELWEQVEARQKSKTLTNPFAGR